MHPVRAGLAALLALVLFPVVWLIARPLRLLGIAVEGVFALLKALQCATTAGVANSRPTTARA